MKLLLIRISRKIIEQVTVPRLVKFIESATGGGNCMHIYITCGGYQPILPTLKQSLRIKLPFTKIAI
jgi:hypothetical protein